MTWQQALRSGTLSKEKPQRSSSPLLSGLHATPTLLWIAHRQVSRTSLSDQLPLDLTGLHWRTRQVSRQEMPSILNLMSSCGLRVLVSRGGITFAAASSGLAPLQVVASESDVRTLSVHLDPRGERACAFADAVHQMEEHACHDFPIQGPRTSHWLPLEIARGERDWWRDTTGGNKQWGFHRRTLELTSTPSCARCLVTARITPWSRKLGILIGLTFVVLPGIRWTIRPKVPGGTWSGFHWFHQI